VIQSILFFILGFLCAGFLALMVAPAIWRRAVALTRRRIEASVPLTLTEIQADKDRMRAEFAMSTRRLEMSVKSFRDKAAAQVVEINRGREELKRLAAERNDKNEGLTELETKASELRAELGRREEQLQRLSDKLADAEKALEQLSGDVSALRDARKDAEQRYQEIVAEGRTTRDALKAEKRRAAELERKVDRLTSSLHDREETLDRREKELARLREKLKGGSVAEDELNRQVIEAQSEKVRLEAELASLTLQMSTLLSGAKGGDIEKAMEKLSADRDRLEDRLTALTRENRKLKDDIAAYERSKSEDWSDDRRESALLREQMNDLAAEVVKLTATLDGPDSPIARALAAPPIHGQPVNDPGEKVASLADRVRALQKAASAG
jgi:chromosome segregation ATPase